MKFPIPALIFALAASVSATCTINGSGAHTVGDERCCWGTDDPQNACYRQNGGMGCFNGAENRNFCTKVGDPARCNADCCDIKTGRGQPCPKGKNRCDSEGGCPYRIYPSGDLR